MSWYTAAELAELQLPDVPRTKRGVQKLAQREDWQARRRQARGGGWEYHLTNLPAQAQAELTVREAPPVPAKDQAQEPAKASTKAVQTDVSEGPKYPPKQWQTDIRDARAALVHEVKRLSERIGLQAAEDYVASAACNGRLPDPLQQLAQTANARAGDSRVLSRPTLRNWRYQLDKHGVDALLPKACPHERTAAPEWLWPLMYYYARPSKPSIRWCREQLARDGYKMPTVRTCQREIQKLGALQQNRGRLGPRELKRLRAFKVRDFQHLQPADVYAGDGHRINQEVLHPRHGKPFRPEVTTIIDVATRRIVGWSAGLDESAWLVADALRHAGETAVPAIFYTDRGSGFINDHLSTSAYSVLARMGTTRETSLPYNSQARGVIERVHRSVHDRESRALPGYVGADMDKEARQRAYKATRKDMRERGSTNKLLGWEDFLQWLADTVAAYNARPHTGLPKFDDPETGRRRHMAPDECWERAVAAGADIFTLSEGELQDIFRPYETRTVQRAQVQLHGKTYFSTELERQDLHGQEVLVGYDIHDPSQVWIRNAEGQFVCTAELDANKTPFFPKARIEEAREKRAKGRMQRLETRANEVREELDPKVIPAPVAQSDRVTQEEKADLEREIYAERPASGRDNRRLEFARALHMERRLNAGEQLAEAELRWLRSYQTTADYETFQQMVEDFGTSFLPSVEENPAEAGTSTGRN